jgi:hypothetical protein
MEPPREADFAAGPEPLLLGSDRAGIGGMESDIVDGTRKGAGLPDFGFFLPCGALRLVLRGRGPGCDRGRRGSDLQCCAEKLFAADEDGE